MKIKKEIKYICLILFFAVYLLILPVNSADEKIDMIQQIKSQSVVLLDGDTGQVLFEKNMNEKLYPASVTKIMTGLIALEKGKLSDIITMSYDAVWSIGRDTSNIALDVDEQITLEQALYALAIESANDAANGIAELIYGSMDEFARQMTLKAKELGALNTNFVNAHGLTDEAHYTTAHDIALIMAAAVKIPEFKRFFTAVTYFIPPTNKQPLPTPCNRKNSLVEGYYAYDGIIGEKTGWTPEAGFTYVAAARRGGRTLVAVVMKSPEVTARWQDATILLDYGFNEFKPVSFDAKEFSKEKYIIEGADGSKISADLIPEKNFNCYILKSLNKEDIKINYALTADSLNGKISGKAIFSLNSGGTTLMFTELGETNLQINFNPREESDITEIPANSNSTAANANNKRNDQPVEAAAKKSIFAIIFSFFSVILQIIGFIAIIILILYIRNYIILQKKKKQRRRRNNNNNNNNNPPMYK